MDFKKGGNMFKRFMALSLVLLLCALPGPLFAAEPMDILKVPVDQIITLLKDPRYHSPNAKKEQATKIWDIVKDIFDFRKISQLSLAQYWKKFNGEQKEIFTETFTKLLGDTYIEKIQGGFQDEHVVFISEEQITPSKALVKTKIVRQSIDIPVHYKLYLRKDKWKIYDINIEGISLVKNYRSQFKKILVNETPDQLIERLKKKNELTEKMKTRKERK